MNNIFELDNWIIYEMWDLIDIHKSKINDFENLVLMKILESYIIIHKS